MTGLLDSILDNMSGSPRIVAEQHDISKIDWRAGVGDVAEMIKMGRDVVQAAQGRAALDNTTGRVALMTAGKAPWHKLGVNVESAVNSAHAMRLSATDWTVSKRPVQYQHNGESRTMPDSYVIVRDDTGAGLSTVGKVFKPYQNVDCFATVDAVLQEYGAKYETAGSLHGGLKIFMCAQLPAQRFQVNGETQLPYVVLMNTHGYGSAQLFATALRPECANTLRLSFARRSRDKCLAIRHTGKLESRVDEAREALGLTVQGIGQYAEQAQSLTSKRVDIRHYANDVLDAVLDVTQAQVSMGADVLAASIAVTQAARDLAAKDFARKIERRGDILEDIMERYESRTNGVNGMRGTAWSAFNAVTEHADHNRIGRQRGDEMGRAALRFESTLSGAGDDMKQVALEYALRA